ncbi:zinc-finger-containing protein [Rhodoferax antarcticus]|uniref:Uncharacterized protein n=1 Tax=Rhodoferax antarcticus ANT.BR TaxID=1111071 RepID=A0A1Q8Y9A5_9BURK|nr:zinc-finger-containing protein [Rhodoferax antarcticus]OLP04559.1 hypothetical protein BLL52_4097 [Rhodoferax antarcticus ANT.BR]
MKAVKCLYCGAAAELKDAFVIYRRLGLGHVYMCSGDCDAYVGVHEGTTKPKGSLANRELRELRQRVHAVFDPIWKQGGYERSELYEAAAKALGIAEFHVGEMRESEAKLFLSHGDALVKNMMAQVDASREAAIASTAGTNIVNVLRYLFVTSQRMPVKVLSYSRYRGHADTFRCACAAGFIRRFKAKETNREFVALTPLGEVALDLRSAVR